MTDDEIINPLAKEIEQLARALIIRILEDERAKRPEPLEELLTAKQVGALFQRDDDFVYKLRREGHLKAVQVTDRTYMFDPSEVRRFIEEGGIAKK